MVLKIITFLIYKNCALYYLGREKAKNHLRSVTSNSPPTPHIVPCGKFHRIGGAPPETFSSGKYDAPEEVGGNKKSFDSPIRK